MAVTRKTITMQRPDDLVVTNTYNLSDVDRITLGDRSGDEQEIILSVRASSVSTALCNIMLLVQRWHTQTVLIRLLF